MSMQSAGSCKRPSGNAHADGRFAQTAYEITPEYETTPTLKRRVSSKTPSPNIFYMSVSIPVVATESRKSCHPVDRYSNSVHSSCRWQSALHGTPRSVFPSYRHYTGNAFNRGTDGATRAAGSSTRMDVPLQAPCHYTSHSTSTPFQPLCIGGPCTADVPDNHEGCKVSESSRVHW